MFSSFKDVLNYLDTLGMFHMDLGLDRIQRALRKLRLQPGDDEWHPYVVHVVGTNGKGSTSTFLSSLGIAHGLSAGLYTSPHFLTPRERIRINGEMLPERAWPQLASDVYKAAPDLTYFELLTAVAMLAFKRAQVDLLVLEAGLGGRYDATTAIMADLVCFTPIDMDHTKVLGPTIEAIAEDKAHAIVPEKPVITVCQKESVLSIIQKKAKECRSPLHYAWEACQLPQDVSLGLRGCYQHENAQLALSAWSLAARTRQWPVDNVCIRDGLQHAFLAGRFQRISGNGEMPPLILDGGHNPHGLGACLTALKSEGIHPKAVVFSCLGDKNIDLMLPIVAEMANGVPLFIPTIQDNERAMDSAELAARFHSLHAPCHPSHVEAEHRLSLALKKAFCVPAREEGALVLICGSLYLLSEFFSLFPHFFR